MGRLCPCHTRFFRWLIGMDRMGSRNVPHFFAVLQEGLVESPCLTLGSSHMFWRRSLPFPEPAPVLSKLQNLSQFFSGGTSQQDFIVYDYGWVGKSSSPTQNVLPYRFFVFSAAQINVNIFVFNFQVLKSLFCSFAPAAGAYGIQDNFMLTIFALNFCCQHLIPDNTLSRHDLSIDEMGFCRYLMRRFFIRFMDRINKTGVTIRIQARFKKMDG